MEAYNLLTALLDLDNARLNELEGFIEEGEAMGLDTTAARIDHSTTRTMRNLHATILASLQNDYKLIS